MRFNIYIIFLFVFIQYQQCLSTSEQKSKQKTYLEPLKDKEQLSERSITDRQPRWFSLTRPFANLFGKSKRNKDINKNRSHRSRKNIQKRIHLKGSLNNSNINVNKNVQKIPRFQNQNQTKFKPFFPPTNTTTVRKSNNNNSSFIVKRKSTKLSNVKKPPTQKLTELKGRPNRDQKFSRRSFNLVKNLIDNLKRQHHIKPRRKYRPRKPHKKRPSAGYGVPKTRPLSTTKAPKPYTSVENYNTPKTHPITDNDSYGSPKAQPIADIDSYGAPKAQPISNIDSYGSPKAQPISDNDNYGSPKAQPTSDNNSYGSPKAQTTSNIDNYGSSKEPIIATVVEKYITQKQKTSKSEVTVPPNNKYVKASTAPSYNIKTTYRPIVTSTFSSSYSSLIQTTDSKKEETSQDRYQNKISPWQPTSFISPFSKEFEKDIPKFDGASSFSFPSFNFEDNFNFGSGRFKSFFDQSLFDSTTISPSNNTPVQEREFSGTSNAPPNSEVKNKNVDSLLSSPIEALTKTESVGFRPSTKTVQFKRSSLYRRIPTIFQGANDNKKSSSNKNFRGTLSDNFWNNEPLDSVFHSYDKHRHHNIKRASERSEMPLNSPSSFRRRTSLRNNEHYTHNARQQLERRQPPKIRNYQNEAGFHLRNQFIRKTTPKPVVRQRIQQFVPNTNNYASRFSVPSSEHFLPMKSPPIKTMSQRSSVEQHLNRPVMTDYDYYLMHHNQENKMPNNEISSQSSLPQRQDYKRPMNNDKDFSKTDLKGKTVVHVTDDYYYYYDDDDVEHAVENPFYGSNDPDLPIRHKPRSTTIAKSTTEHTQYMSKQDAMQPKISSDLAYDDYSYYYSDDDDENEEFIYEEKLNSFPKKRMSIEIKPVETAKTNDKLWNGPNEKQQFRYKKPQDYSQQIKDANMCQGESFCSVKDPNYPLEFVESIVLSEGPAVQGTYQRIIMESPGMLGLWESKRRKHRPTVAGSCETVESILKPGWSKSTENEWLLVVNTNEYQQEIRINKCRSSKERCPNRFNNEKRSSECVEKFTDKLLMVVNPQLPEKGTFTAHFRVPSGCKCEDVSLKNLLEPNLTKTSQKNDFSSTKKRFNFVQGMSATTPLTNDIRITRNNIYKPKNALRRYDTNIKDNDDGINYASTTMTTKHTMSTSRINSHNDNTEINDLKITQPYEAHNKENEATNMEKLTNKKDTFFVPSNNESELDDNDDENDLFMNNKNLQKVDESSMSEDGFLFSQSIELATLFNLSSSTEMNQNNPILKTAIEPNATSMLHSRKRVLPNKSANINLLIPMEDSGLDKKTHMTQEQRIHRLQDRYRSQLIKSKRATTVNIDTVTSSVTDTTDKNSETTTTTSPGAVTDSYTFRPTQRTITGLKMKKASNFFANYRNRNKNEKKFEVIGRDEEKEKETNHKDQINVRPFFTGVKQRDSSTTTRTKENTDIIVTLKTTARPRYSSSKNKNRYSKRKNTYKHLKENDSNNDETKSVDSLKSMLRNGLRDPTKIKEMFEKIQDKKSKKEKLGSKKTFDQLEDTDVSISAGDNKNLEHSSRSRSSAAGSAYMKYLSANRSKKRKNEKDEYASQIYKKFSKLATTTTEISMELNNKPKKRQKPNRKHQRPFVPTPPSPIVTSTNLQHVNIPSIDWNSPVVKNDNDKNPSNYLLETNMFIKAEDDQPTQSSSIWRSKDEKKLEEEDANIPRSRIPIRDVLNIFQELKLSFGGLN